jgi:hypothetical protein
MNFQILNQFKQSRKKERNLFEFPGPWAEIACVACPGLSQQWPRAQLTAARPARVHSSQHTMREHGRR